MHNTDSSEKTKQKRERSVNFTQAETDLLVSLAAIKKHIIENKKSGATAWQDKEKAWLAIEGAFNRSSGLVYRDHKTLKLKYEGLKRDIRKKNALIRAEISKTGSGSSTAPVFTATEQRVRQILLSVERNETNVDSDFVLLGTSTSIQDSIIWPEEQNVQTITEQSSSDDSSNSSLIIEMEEQNVEPPRKKKSNGTQEEGPVQCEPKEKKPLDIEKTEIARIQKRIVTEELEQQLIKRKILEKELEHKDIMQELEKQHLLLKIELLKRVLGEKSRNVCFI